jgi:PrtD family type I secretion system ABC transporter
MEEFVKKARLSQSGQDTQIKAAMGACRAFFINAAIFSAFLNILYLAPTIYMLQVYDRVVPTRGFATLGLLTGLFVAAAATIAVLDLVRTRLFVIASQRLDIQLSGSIFDTLMRSGASNGTITNSTMMREFDQLRGALTGQGMLALFDLPWAPVYILVCFLLHPYLGLFAIVGGLLLGLLSWVNERVTKAAIQRVHGSSQAVFQAMDSALANAGVVGALGMRKAFVRIQMAERLSTNLISARAGMRTAVITSFVKALRLMLQSLALGLGAYLVISQQMSPGAIFAASLLVSRALAPIEMITAAWKSLAQAAAAYEQISQLFEGVGPMPMRTWLPDVQGHLHAEGVAVASPARDRLLLQGVSFRLNAGEMLGVIGPSGAGKSTLARALVGISPTVNGVVRIDGAALPDWPERQLTGAIGYVPQEPTLFRGTIKENIARFQNTFPGEGGLDAEVVRASQLSGVHEFIMRMPAGYETELGYNGIGLSVGQAQRVALARALFGSPRVLVLDEPNSALDADGEMHLIRTLAELRRQKVTIVVVAHRAGILADVDKLLVIRDGRAELFGPRQEVLDRLARANPPVSKVAADNASGS